MSSYLQDGEVVVHHDCEVKLSIGQEAVLLGIPSLTSKQLRRCGRARWKPGPPSAVECIVQPCHLRLHSGVLK